MRTLIVSDLHLGSRSGRDLLRRSPARPPLLEAAEDADRLVLLGDVLELRDAPVAAILEAADPVLAELGEAAGEAEVVVLAGNHDHRLAGEWLERRRVDGSFRLGPAETWDARGPGVLGAVAKHFHGEVIGAYPGYLVRDDVYVTHGHYLDLHNSVPAFEVLAGAAAARITGGSRSGAAAPADYEAALTPVYDLLHSLAQGLGSRGPAGAGASMRVLQRVQHPRGTLDVPHLLLARVLLPGAVAAANGLGLGRFNSDLSGRELRRASLHAMGEVVSRLGIGVPHVVFGHTHRRGPIEGDDASDWRVAGGTELLNSGSWVHEPGLLAADGPANPYWPGAVVVVEDADPPRLEDLLDEIPAPTAA